MVRAIVFREYMLDVHSVVSRPGRWVLRVAAHWSEAMNTPAFIRRLTSPLGIAVLLWLVGYGVFYEELVSQRNMTAGNGPNVDVPISFAGLPLAVIFRHNNLHAVHWRWGTLVLIVAPAIIGITVALYRLRQRRRLTTIETEPASLRSRR
jgi:hypothetical protein